MMGSVAAVIRTVAMDLAADRRRCAPQLGDPAHARLGPQQTGDLDPFLL
jgi:hypothetical protein